MPASDEAGLPNDSKPAKRKGFLSAEEPRRAAVPTTPTSAIQRGQPSHTRTAFDDWPKALGGVVGFLVEPTETARATFEDRDLPATVQEADARQERQAIDQDGDARRNGRFRS